MACVVGKQLKDDMVWGQWSYRVEAAILALGANRLYYR